MMPSDIVPPQLVVKAMRDSGYKNAAYAIAELMDNAIQANATNVELICAERTERTNRGSSTRINKIAVLDDGDGMDPQVLRMALQFGNGTRLDDFSGIGRFGMGLPNSSISQARRVDVWSWQNGVDSAVHTYLDLDQIVAGELREVPEPRTKEIPIEWRNAGKVFSKSGTLVVWSDLDRLMWRTARTVIRHSEMVIGRMYRYFLKDDSVRIRFSTIDLDSNQDAMLSEEHFARPTDPLYLMSDTSCPEPYGKEPMFTQGDFQNTDFQILFNGDVHTVTVRFAYAKEEAREGHNPGSRPYGRHAAKNAGVSLMRANRELDLDAAWTDPSEPRDRWWGVEVSFPPALDDLFGVTNNKQAARNFSELAKADLESLVEDGQTLGAAMDELNGDQDPRLPLLEIAQHVKTNISTIRSLIKAQTSSTRRQRHAGHSRSEEKGTEATRKRIEMGYRSESDDAESSLSPDARAKEIRSELVEHGTPEKVADQLAAQTVGRGLKYTFTESHVNSPAFFDVKSRGGAIIIGLNVNHAAYSRLIEVLRDNGESEDADALRLRLAKASEGLELLLMAWARYEDEQPDGPRRTHAQEARWDWGRMAREFLVDDSTG